MHAVSAATVSTLYTLRVVHTGTVVHAIFDYTAMSDCLLYVLSADFPFSVFHLLPSDEHAEVVRADCPGRVRAELPGLRLRRHDRVRLRPPRQTEIPRAKGG